jgi:hypothetical protein
MRQVARLKPARTQAVAPAPPWLTGLWQRESLIYANGDQDLNSLVLWGQTPSRFVDLRIPEARLKPGRAGKNMASFPIQLCAQQEGFAGWIELNNGICRWHREIDFQPASGILDQARLHRQRNILYEDAVDAPGGVPSYKEVFRCIRTDPKVCVGFDLGSLDGEIFGTARHTPGILVLIGDVFLFARDRPVALRRAASLTKLISRQRTSQADITNALDCEISYGSLRPGANAWHIVRSTRPEREGKRLFETPRSIAQDGAALTLVTRSGRATWHATDAIPPDLDLPALFGL